jgi:hypothetical protein
MNISEYVIRGGAAERERLLVRFPGDALFFVDYSDAQVGSNFDFPIIAASA